MTTDAELEQCICSIIVKGMTDPVLPFTSAQAVLAAIRASGRLTPELSDDVVKAAGDAGIKALEAYNAEHYMPNWKDSTRAAVAGAAPLIAAAAEAKAREECARIAEADRPSQECPYTCDKPGDPTWGHTEEDICPACHVACADSGAKCLGVAKHRIAAAIRTGSAS